MKDKILVAMSGGVDSAVSALLIKNNYSDCVGTTMNLAPALPGAGDGQQSSTHRLTGLTAELPGLTDNLQDRADGLQGGAEGLQGGADDGNSCCSSKDIEDAASIAKSLGIEHYVFNLKADFNEKVIKKFVEAYENGYTPNPCIDCNRFIKFDLLFESARELNCSKIATGHYACIEYDNVFGRYLLKKGKDVSKDQSYVLYSLTQEKLSKIIFPLGEFTKDKVRQLAADNGFHVATKKESQDICFVKDGNYVNFIRSYTGKEYPCGDFIDVHGNILGTHKGIINYTIGQRKGLGVSFGKPVYVYAKDPVNNTVTLASDDDLMNLELTANNINLISVDSIKEPMKVKARTRYNQKEQPATVIQLDEDRIKVTFDSPQRAFAAGQAVVLYDNDIVVGGGTIM